MELQLLSQAELLDAWRDFVRGDQAHASLRIGDVEAAVAAHDEILTMRFVRRFYAWTDNYYGLRLPDAAARDRLVEALRRADYLGILTQPDWECRPLAEMVVAYHAIRPQRFFYAFENYYVSRNKTFYEYFADTPTLLVGGKAERFREVLERRYGWRRIVGTVYQWKWQELDAAVQAMDRFPYRLALVSAGVAGKILAVHAKQTGHVGIDFGSGLDTCVQADADGMYAWQWDKFPSYSWPSGEHVLAQPPLGGTP